jgi:cystathionine gamma-synthase
MTSFQTRAVHAGLSPDPTYGSVIPAIHQTSTYRQRAVGEFVGDFDYARSANPTRSALEEALGELEGGLATAYSSGLAAAHAVFVQVCRPGDHVVLPADLYGGTFRLVDTILAPWGLRYSLVDQTDLDALAAAIEPGATKLVWVETPTNPLLNVVDVAGVVARVAGGADAGGGARGVAGGGAAAVGDRPLVAVDNTFATPVNQRPLTDGADVVVHSTTKYLGGHSDVVGGAVIVRDAALHERMRFAQNAIGSVPGPFDCFLVHRGLRTLPLRMRAHAESAAAVAEALRGEVGVHDVRWPGFSGMVSFRHPDAVGIAQRTTLFTLAESLGGVESLIEVPAAMTHQSVEDSDAAVPADLVRLSCGIEAPADLVADLRAALTAAPTPAHR